MYTPTLSITHKMVHHIVKIELAVKEIKDTPLSSVARKKLLNRMTSESLYNVGKLVGTEVAYKDAEKIALGKAIVSPGSPETVLSNYRSMCDFIYSASNDRYVSLSPSLLLHLNKLVINGLVDSWDGGRFRNVSDDVDPKYDNWYSYQSHDLEGVDLQQHYYGVLNWFSENKFLIHPMIKIGCVIYELFRYYPFVAGNQLTILAVAELLFEKSKLSLDGLMPVSRNFVLYEDEYLEALRISIEKDGDQTLWIERFIRGVSLDLSALKNEVVRLEEEKLKRKKKRLLDLNSRQLRIIRYLKHNGKISRMEYVKMMGVSTMTAYRDLNELVDRKIIDVRGGGRSTYYILSKTEETKEDQEEARKKKVVKVISDYAQSPYSSGSQNSQDDNNEDFSSIYKNNQGGGITL
ncbi:DeoR family transcriptional regulator [Candidatus Dojkabacteria bacterium]|nr:DeoR family transcriptional regulator [Candidatus Dojkabacteria bacterium]